MKKSLLIATVTLISGLTANQVFAQTAPATQDTTKTTATTATAPATTTAATTTAATAQVGAADVVGALNSNADYSTAASAVKAAELEGTLKAGGPYTIFAPNNAAFSKLPAGEVDSLLKDPVKLGALLKGHVVTGKYAKADIIKALNAGKGKAILTTIDGQKLTLGVSPSKTLQLTNAAGNSSEVVLYDLVGSNGIVNGINNVLEPAAKAAPSR